MLIVTALMAVTLFAPLAWFAGEAGEFGLYAFSLKTAAGEAVQPTVYMGWPASAVYRKVEHLSRSRSDSAVLRKVVHLK